MPRKQSGSFGKKNSIKRYKKMYNKDENLQKLEKELKKQWRRHNFASQRDQY